MNEFFGGEPIVCFLFGCSLEMRQNAKAWWGGLVLGFLRRSDWYSGSHWRMVVEDDAG